MIDFEKNYSSIGEKITKNFESIKRAWREMGGFVGHSLFDESVRMLSTEPKPNKYVFIDAEGKIYHD